MKKLFTILIMIITIGSYSQVSTISYDSFDSLKKETSSFYNELGNITATLTRYKLVLEIDLDGQGYDYNGVTLNYYYSTPPKLIFDLNTESNVILFDIVGSGYSPIGCIILPSSNTIKLFFDSGGMLIYFGEGIRIII